MFQGGSSSMEPAPLVHAPSGASTVGWQDSARVGSPASSYHSSGSPGHLVGGLSRQLRPSAMQQDAAAAYADAALLGSSAALTGEAGTRDQVHLDADLMAQVHAGMGLSPASAAASADWWQSGSPSFGRSVQDDLCETDSLGSAWGGSSMGSQAPDSDMGSVGDAEEDLKETPGSDGGDAAQGRDHLATKAYENKSAFVQEAVRSVSMRGCNCSMSSG